VVKSYTNPLLIIRIYRQRKEGVFGCITEKKNNLFRLPVFIAAELVATEIFLVAGGSILGKLLETSAIQAVHYRRM